MTDAPPHFCTSKSLMVVMVVVVVVGPCSSRRSGRGTT